MELHLHGSAAFRGVIEDVNVIRSTSKEWCEQIHVDPDILARKPVIKVDFAMERYVDNETNEVGRSKLTCFVRNVFDKDGKRLSELDLLALRGCRAEARYFTPDRCVIFVID